MKQIIQVLFLTVLSCNTLFSQKGFTVTKKSNLYIYYEHGNSGLYGITAKLLAADIESFLGVRPQVTSNPKALKGQVILIGSIHNEFILHVLGNKKSMAKGLQGEWERFLICQDKPSGNNIEQALIIAGSDPRGTAYGVFHISELMGVSPWYWWADIAPQPKEEINLKIDDYVSNTPSVQFRGIFLNDEDWGLQPWAAKTFEPETGDIGPKTYEKIFELLLRLKANMIWPAMHPCTKAFFSYPGNVEMAKKYEVYIGTSHAEPMLRNNVDEWDKKTMGAFNYQTNSETVKKYWEERVKESTNVNGIYTLGMRGVHDSGMEGFDNMDQKAKAMETILMDQREMLKKYINEDATKIPQVFTPYKEVLDIYDHGLLVPDDVTIVWTDDNYGYIKRLPNKEEQKRLGGSGVYYHISYWGRPHDYLWLSTTYPILIWEEMSKAYFSNANKLWVVNVGDIKPNEYGMELFLEMAYDIDKFKSPQKVWEHLQDWCDAIVPGKGVELGNAYKKYYELAWQRRPEFMGWSQTEPNTVISPTAFNHIAYGDEASHRLIQYQRLSNVVDSVQKAVPSRNKDAYLQLVEYPIKCAAWMNQKFIDLEKSKLYADQARLSANDYAENAQKAYSRIANYTNRYNNVKLGKWNHIMDMAPRRLPVFELPMIPHWDAGSRKGIHINLEGFTNEAYRNDKSCYLPSFLEGQQTSRFVDVYLMGGGAGNYTLESSVDWIVLSQSHGELKDAPGMKEDRIWVSVDWTKIKDEKNTGIIALNGEGYRQKIIVKAYKPSQSALNSGADYMEHRKIVSIHAENFSRSEGDGWQVIDGLGYTGKVISSGYNSDAGSVSYDFYTLSKGNIKVHYFGVPVHPLNDQYELRMEVKLDSIVVDTVNFKTYGRSEEWKQNVLSNSTHKTVETYLDNPGKHTLTIQALDPQVFIDRVIIDFGGYQGAYSVVEETRIGGLGHE